MAVQQKQAQKEASICKGNINTLASGAIESRNKSALLMKEITALVVSSILYYRKIIPQEMFVDKKVGTQRVKILKAKTDHTLADNFCEMIFSVHESIELGYLKKLILTFLENNEPVEVHKLYFEHTGESYKTIMIDQVYSKSKIHLKHQITKLKDTIFETIARFIQTLVNVPHQIEQPHVSVELNYYEVTPKDYVPRHFEPFDESKEKHRLATQPINFGHITTPFHALKLKSQFRSGLNEEVIKKLKETETEFEKTESTNGIEKSEASKASQGIPSFDDFMNLMGKPVVITSDETEMNNNNFSSIHVENGSNIIENRNTYGFTHVENQLVGEIMNAENIKEEVFVMTEDQTPAEDMLGDADSVVENEVRCPCKIDINECCLVQCDNCKTYQHIYCFDMLTLEHVAPTHICDRCAICNPNLHCTVPALCSLDTEAKLHRCIFRLILGLSYLNCNKVSKDYLINKLQLDDSFADDLLHRFDKLQIAHRSGGTINRRLFERRTVPSIFKDLSMSCKPESPPVAIKRARTQ